MGRFKRCDYTQGMFIPVYMEEQLMPGTLEYAIHTLVEKHIDLSIFDGKYSNDETGRLAYDPKILLKVVLLGYSRGLMTSRKIEQACRDNIVFMAMSCNQHPDHTTIASFVSSMGKEILPLFRNILMVCEELGLLGGTFFALDGCKLPGNAARKWSGTHGSLKIKKQKIEEKVREIIKHQQEEDRKGDPVIDNLEKQIDKLNRQAERIGRWLKDNEPRKGSKGQELQGNVTDSDSVLMNTSHGTIQGYNSQALVDSKHQVIIHGEVFGDGQDAKLASPMIEGAKANMGDEGYFNGKILVADSGYHSSSNIGKCVDEGLDAYIPDRQFRTRDTRFDEKRRVTRTHFSHKDFFYDGENDRYICPNGQVLGIAVRRHVSENTLYRWYRAKDCNGCPLKAKCIYGNGKGPKTLTIPLGPDGMNYSKMMVKKIDSEYGRKIYNQRMPIVEPVFANIRTVKRLDRFTLRGKIKANIQWLLYCMVHNIEKVANYGFAY
jgi:transposase